jgi:hypothetical protein
MYQSLGLKVQLLQKTLHESYKTGNVAGDMKQSMVSRESFKDSGSYPLYNHIEDINNDKLSLCILSIHTRKELSGRRL